MMADAAVVGAVVGEAGEAKEAGDGTPAEDGANDAKSGDGTEEEEGEGGQEGEKSSGPSAFQQAQMAHPMMMNWGQFGGLQGYPMQVRHWSPV